MDKEFKIQTLEQLLKYYECSSIQELWNYIEYLKDVRSDYECLKKKVKNLASEINQMY